MGKVKRKNAHPCQRPLHQRFRKRKVQVRKCGVMVTTLPLSNVASVQIQELIGSNPDLDVFLCPTFVTC